MLISSKSVQNLITFHILMYLFDTLLILFYYFEFYYAAKNNVVQCCACSNFCIESAMPQKETHSLSYLNS